MLRGTKYNGGKSKWPIAQEKPLLLHPATIFSQLPWTSWKTDSSLIVRASSGHYKQLQTQQPVDAGQASKKYHETEKQNGAVP